MLKTGYSIDKIVGKFRQYRVWRANYSQPYSYQAELWPLFPIFILGTGKIEIP